MERTGLLPAHSQAVMIERIAVSCSSDFALR